MKRPALILIAAAVAVGGMWFAMRDRREEHAAIVAEAAKPEPAATKDLVERLDPAESLPGRVEVPTEIDASATAPETSRASAPAPAILFSKARFRMLRDGKPFRPQCPDENFASLVYAEPVAVGTPPSGFYNVLSDGTVTFPLVAIARCRLELHFRSWGTSVVTQPVIDLASAIQSPNWIEIEIGTSVCEFGITAVLPFGASKERLVASMCMHAARREYDDATSVVLVESQTLLAPIDEGSVVTVVAPECKPIDVPIRAGMHKCQLQWSELSIELDCTIQLEDGTPPAHIDAILERTPNNLSCRRWKGSECDMLDTGGAHFAATVRQVTGKDVVILKGLQPGTYRLKYQVRGLGEPKTENTAYPSIKHAQIVLSESIPTVYLRETLYVQNAGKYPMLFLSPP